MSKWLERKGLLVKVLKKEFREKMCKAGQYVRKGDVTSAYKNGRFSQSDKYGNSRIAHTL